MDERNAFRRPIAARDFARGLLLLVLLAGARPATATWQGYKASLGGLADDRIQQIAEAPDGRIWFATAAGASVFDGSRWTTLVDSLPDPLVYAVLPARDGSVWFGTRSGIAVLRDGRWQRVTTVPDPLPSPFVYALAEDHRGDIWAGTGAGLVRYEPAADRWTTYAPGAAGPPAAQVVALLADSRRRLWMATPFGVGMLDSTRTQWTTLRADPQALGRDSVLCLAEDARARVWFGTDQGAWSFGDDGWRHWTTADGLAGNLVLGMARDRAGDLWLGALNGVAHGDGVTFRTDVKTTDDVPLGPIAALFGDSAGNVWLGGRTYDFFGAFSRGSFRFDGVAWRNYLSPAYNVPPCNAVPSPNIPTAYVLPGNCMTAGLQDHAGALWFATAETGVARLARSGTWAAFRRGVGVPLSDSVVALAEDASGTLWFASPGSGLAALDSTRSTWSLHTTAHGLPSNDVRTLFVDRAGVPWAGTALGLARCAGSAWLEVGLGEPAEVQRFAEDGEGRLWVQAVQGLYSIEPDRVTVRRWTTADGLGDDYPTALLAARDGSVWIGTALSVSRLANGAWTNWPTNFNAVNELAESPGGEVWAATGLDARRWNGSNWEVFGFPQFVPGTPVQHLAFEPGGTVWASTPAGVGRFSGRAWKKLDSKGNGLTRDEIVGAFTDTQGRMWVLGAAGLAEHEPDLTAPQTVFVSTNEKVSPSRNVSLVFGAAYGELADLEYRTRWDAEPWSDWTADNTWYRPGVADGPHTFSVIARDWAGNVDPTPATYTFVLDATPPPAEITSPASGLPVRGACAIVGSTSDPRFRAARVEARPLGAAAWTYVLGTSASPVSGDTLAVWDTSVLPDGDWELRVAVDDTLGLTGVARVRVIVDNVAPFANVTSPVRLVATDGGDVFTTNAEAHLYFPPNAFDADPVVSVDSLAAGAAPDTLPGGAARRGPAWSIGWTNGRLDKAGVLELRPWSPGGALAVWRRTGPGAWTRLGGTPQDGGALALTLDAPGDYALFASGPLPAAGRTLDALTFTPRAFSPSGAFANAQVAIGFTLARPGAATVKLYNRAGRLVRTVARGMSATAGENLVRWDGRDESGGTVDPGLYLVAVEALGETLTRPLAVVK